MSRIVRGYVVSGSEVAGYTFAVPRRGAPREPSKLGSESQELNSEELSSVWACAVWACVRSCRHVLMRRVGWWPRRIYLHVPAFLRWPGVIRNSRPKLTSRGVLLPVMWPAHGYISARMQVI